jgi:integrase
MGILISEAMGLKWEDIDYQDKQINLCRVWVSDKIVEKMKTEDSEARNCGRRNGDGLETQLQLRLDVNPLT